MFYAVPATQVISRRHVGQCRLVWTSALTTVSRDEFFEGRHISCPCQDCSSKVSVYPVTSLSLLLSGRRGWLYMSFNPAWGLTWMDEKRKRHWKISPLFTGCCLLDNGKTVVAHCCCVRVVVYTTFVFFLYKIVFICVCISWKTAKRDRLWKNILIGKRS